MSRFIDFNMESRFFPYQIDEIAKGHGWTFKRAVRRSWISDLAFGRTSVIRVQTNGERIENIIRKAEVPFWVLPVVSTEFRLLEIEPRYINRQYPYMLAKNDFFGGPGTFFLLDSLPLDFDFIALMEDVNRQLDYGEEPARAKTAAELLMDRADARARKLCREIHKNEEDPCALIFSDDVEEKYPDTYYLEAVTALREYGYSPEDVLRMPGVESNPFVVEFAEKLLAWKKGR